MKQRYFFIVLAFIFSVPKLFAGSYFIDPPTVKHTKTFDVSATISGSTSVCINAAQPNLTITGSGGTAPYTFVYKINNGANFTATSTGNSALIPVATATAGTFVYTLVSVTDSSQGATPETVTATATVTIVPNFTVTAGNNITVCKGSPISLTSTLSAGAPSGVTYSWSGPNNYSSSSQSPTISSATPAMAGTYTVTASVGQCEKTDNMTITVLEPTVSSSQLQEYQGSDWLVRCTSPGAVSGTIFVNNGIPSNLQGMVTGYTINWGDSTPVFTSSSSNWNSGNNVNHTYNIGLYTLTISITTNQNCNINKTYTVFVGNQPASPQIQLPINAQGCVPFQLTFPISGVSANTPGTTYTITFSDDPDNPLTFNQSNIPSSVTRTFTTSSCGDTFTNGSNVEQNAFGVSMQAVNPCGSASSSAGPIRTSTPPTAIINGPTTGCTNQTIALSDQSQNGSIVTSSGCNSSSGRYWQISPSTGWTLSGSTLGNDGGFPEEFEGWTNGSQNLNIMFSATGTYTVTLFKRNSCGTTSTTTKVICIESPIVPAFTLNSTTGCMPLAVTATNTTSIIGLCSAPNYLWQVTYAAGNCGSGPVTIANQTTANASYNFTVPGTYTIKLTMTNSCGTYNTTQTVTVKAPPTVSINTIPSVCGGSSAVINPTANVTNCGTQAVTYAWSFPGGTPATSTLQNPTNISYSTSGSKTVTLVVTNECGTATSTQTFTVTPAVVANAGTDQTLCSGQAQLNGTGSGGNIPATYQYSWTPIAGLSNPNMANPTANPTATTTYTLTVTNGGCTATDQVTIYKNNVTPGVIATNQTICNGGNPALLTESTAATGAGTLTYQWEVSTTNSTSGYTNVSGATSTTYDPPVTSVPTWYRRKVISTLNGVACDATSNVIEIIINSITPGTIAANQTICTGGTPAAFTAPAATGSGTISYQWQSSSDNNVFTNISGATAATYSPPALTQTTYYKRIAKSSLSGVDCSDNSNVITITVVPDPVISTQPLATQTICQGSPTTQLTVTATVGAGVGALAYQWYSNTSNSTNGGTAITTATSAAYTPPATTVGTQYYYCVVTTSASGCSATSTLAQVQVITAPTISTQPASSTVCVGGTPTQLTVAYTNGTGTPSYQWYSNNNNTPSGGTAISGATASSYSPPATTAGTTYYYVVITFPSGSCSAITSNTATVVVNTPPQVTTQPVATQSICVGGSISALTVAGTTAQGALTYQWYSNTTSATTGGTAISGATNASYTPPTFNTAGTYYYYAVLTYASSGCGTVTSNTAQVNVLADPVISAQPTPSQSLCQSPLAGEISVTATVGAGVGALAYQWYSNTANNTTSGTPIASATSAAYTPPATTVGTQYYYCIVTTSASGCSATSSVAQVQVITAPTISTQPASSTVCVGGTPTQLTVAYTNGTGTPSYQWYSNNNNTPSGGTAISGATASSYSPPATTAGTTYYYVVITFPSGSCSAITSNTATVVVNTPPQVTTQPVATQSICVGGSVAALSVAGTTAQGTLTYQWYSNTTSATTGGTAISGATNASYTPPTFNTAGTYYYYAVLTYASSGCGTVTSNAAQVNVLADPVISAQPTASQSLCQSPLAGEISVTATVGAGVGALAYQWYSNTSNSTNGGTAITTATSAAYTPPATTVGTQYYYCIVTTSASGCSATSSVAQVQVITAPTINTQPASSTVCVGGTPTQLSVAYTNGTGTPSYQWYSNNTNAPSGGTAISGATSASYSPPSSTAGTTYYYVVITFPSGSCSAITSNTATVVVNTPPQVTTQPNANQSICVGGSVAALSVAGTTAQGALTYQWYSNTTSATTGGTAISGATNASYTPPTFNTAGTYYYYAVLTYANSGCGTVTSNAAQVNVLADPVISAQPTPSQSLCQSPLAGEISVTATVGAGVGALAYQWYSNTANNTTSGTPIASATSAAYTPPATTVGTQYYYCVVTTSASGCSATSSVAQVQVITAPTISTQPASSTVCVGGTPTQLSVAYTNGTGTPSYQWYSNNTNAPSGGTAISGATSASYQPSGATVGINYYYVEITFTGGGCSLITSNTATVTVNQLPAITSVPQQTICSGSTFSVTPQAGSGNSIPTGTQYTWTVPANNSITGESNQATLQNIISQTLVNTTNAPVTLTYTVTPVANNCSGATFTVQVTVNPMPFVTPQTAIACNEAVFTVTPANGSGNIVPTGTTYTWSTPVVTGNLTGGQAGTDATSISGTFTNPTNAPQTATYTVTPKWTSGTETCTGETFTVTVTVNPEPAVNDMAVTSCSAAAFTVTPANGTNGIVPANTQYSWSAPAAVTGITGLAAGTNQATFSGNLTNTTNAAITVTYVVTPKAGTCQGETFEVDVTINPEPTVSSITSQTVCNGSQTQAIAFTGNVANTIFNWTNTTPSIGLAASGSGNIAAFQATNPGTSAVTATITVTPVANGCSGTPQTFTIIVNPAPTVIFAPQNNQTVCSGTASTVVNLSSATPNTTIAWTANVPAGITGATTSGTTIIPAQTLVNTTGAALTITYTAIATTSGVSACPGAPSVYTITVTPVPFVDGSQQVTTCSGIALSFVPANTGNTNMPAGVTFTWAAATGSGFTGGGAQTTPQTSLNPTLINTTNAPVTATFSVTPHFAGCNGVPFTVTVTVNPAATVPNTAIALCSGSTFTFNPATVATILPAGTVFSWAAPSGNATGGVAGTEQTTLTGTLTNSTSAVQAVVYTITPLSPIGDCNGAPFTLTVNVNPVFAVTSALSDYNGFQISSAGANDGSINLTVTGGTANYTYAWTGPTGFAATTQDIANIGPGTYTVVVSDGLCENITLTFVIIEPLPLLIAEVLDSHVNVNCFGQSTGVLEVEVTQESIGPYDYTLLLPNGTVVENVMDLVATNYVFDNLPAGIYNIRVTDANGTVKFVNGVAVSQPTSGLAITNAAVSDFNGFSITCNGADDGTIDLTIGGGYPGYTYSWTGPGGFTATTEDISGLSPGSYTVTVLDSTSACPVTQTYTITEPAIVAFTGNVPLFGDYNISCFGGNDGSININPTGGTGAYTYAWTGPGGFTATSEDLVNITAGTYTLTLADTNGCSPAPQSFTLTEPPAIEIVETHEDILCFGAATGAIDVTVTGGMSGAGSTYTYAWTGPDGFTSTSEDLTNIVAGTYNLLVNDNNGCGIPLTVTITQQEEIIVTATTTPVSCYGASDASITLAISGGNGPYTATWDNLATGEFQDNLSAGFYTITISDQNNCIKVVVVEIPEAPIYTVFPVVNQISCHGANDGSIALNLVGGVAPITLTWSDGSTQGTTRNNLPAGTYSVTITDATPCHIFRTFTIVDPAPLSLSANVTHALDCDDAQSGAINLIVAGGRVPYTFDWSNGAITEDLTGITTGNYSVTVTDAGGCTITGTYSITRPDPIVLNITSNVNANCNNHTVLQTNIAQASGGVPPFQYTWSSGIVSGLNGQFMNSNQNGTVLVTATDSQGCSATTTFEVDTQQLGEAEFTAASYAFTTYHLYSIFDPITFENLSTGDYAEVGWNFGDGSTSNEFNPTHTYVREGTYRVILNVVYPYGCTDTFIMTVVVTKGYEVMVPNAFTPNGDSINETFNAVHWGLKSIELNVFDTWGELVYSEKGETLTGWNGYVKNNPSENGNFYYRIKAETFYGHIIEFNGPFVLIK